MGILDRLITHKKAVKTTVWGIRVPNKFKMQWSMLAILMRIPTNHLIMYVLHDWVQQNAETLRDREARNQLADKISEMYLKGNLN